MFQWSGNPKRGDLLKILKSSYGVGRMAIDDAGDVYVWQASGMTLSHLAGALRLAKTGSDNPLTGLSLYAFTDAMAARVCEVGDEDVHPELTAWARRLPNIVRIWGTRVVCLDLHGEP